MRSRRQDFLTPFYISPREKRGNASMSCSARLARHVRCTGKGVGYIQLFGHLRCGKGLAFNHITDQMKLRSKKPGNPSFRLFLDTEISQATSLLLLRGIPRSRQKEGTESKAHSCIVQPIACKIHLAASYLLLYCKTKLPF